MGNHSRAPRRRGGSSRYRCSEEKERLGPHKRVRVGDKKTKPGSIGHRDAPSLGKDGDCFRLFFFGTNSVPFLFVLGNVSLFLNVTGALGAAFTFLRIYGFSESYLFSYIKYVVIVAIFSLPM